MMVCVGRSVRWGAALVLVFVLVWRSDSRAIPLDKDGDFKFGARTYVNARVGTEDTHQGAAPTSSNAGIRQAEAEEQLINGTFPYSESGHLRQNRAFIELSLKYKLDRLMAQGVGPFGLLNDLPFHIKGLGGQFTFRGEGESLYDWGGREYSSAGPFNQLYTLSTPITVAQLIPSPGNTSRLLIGPAPGQPGANQGFINVGDLRNQVHQNGTDRERLFQAFVEGSVGDLFVRVGRQLLSWGETDGFQLLDHINPLDSSFGGFLISLDERRVPLDMIRSDYYIGDFGPISEMFLQGYGAIDNKVGYSPQPPWGSPWTPPALAAPAVNITQPNLVTPTRTFADARGGMLLKFNAVGATFSVAHYYTYFDVPAVQVQTLRPWQTSPILSIPAFNDGLVCPKTDSNGRVIVDAQGHPIPDPSNSACGAPTHTIATAPKVQVTGATTTFALPEYYSVVRSEFAYFRHEAAFTQGQLDPFIFNLQNHQTTGGRRTRDSINYVLGFDVNRFIRFLNPNQTFLISTQFFYKHIIDAAGGNIYNKDGSVNPNREVLPVPALAPYNVQLPFFTSSLPVPIGQTFINQPQDQYLQTLLITTSYRSGIINPYLLMFYDWGGGFVYQPSITFSRDPFRFAISYSILDSHIYKGGSGVSLLKDRDNVEFRLEYVI